MTDRNTQQLDQKIQDALRRGTDTAEGRSPAVWLKIRARKAEPRRRSAVLPLSLAGGVALAAVLLAFFVGPALLHPADVVRPLDTGSAAAGMPNAVTLTTDVERYSPAMSSIFGIHVFAKDRNGNPVKGKWTATWGQFIPATSSPGGVWTLQDGRDEMADASDVFWSTQEGEISTFIQIGFEGGGMNQTLRLMGDAANSGFVSVVKDKDNPNDGLKIGTFSAMLSSSSYVLDAVHGDGVRLTATDGDTAPVRGNWKASWGKLGTQAVARDGAFSILWGGQSLANQSEVWWSYDKGAEKPATVTIQYTCGAETRYVVLRQSAGLYFPDEATVEPETTPALSYKNKYDDLVKGGATLPELYTFVQKYREKMSTADAEAVANALFARMQNALAGYTEQMNKWANDDASRLEAIAAQAGRNELKDTSGLDDEAQALLREVFAAGCTVRTFDGTVAADIRYTDLAAMLGGSAGSELGRYLAVVGPEAEEPSVFEGEIMISLPQLAGRYLAAREFVEAYPKSQYVGDVDDLRLTYLGVLLTLNGQLFADDGFSVSVTHRTAYNELIAMYEKKEPEFAGMLIDYKDLLAANDWALTDPVRDFLTQHGVIGYGRISTGLTWGDMAVWGVGLDTKEQEAVDGLTAAIDSEMISDKTTQDAGGTTRTLTWADGTSAVIRNGKLYSMETASPAATLPKGLKLGETLEQYTAVLGEARQFDGMQVWGVGSNDNVFVTFENGVAVKIKISLVE